MLHEHLDMPLALHPSELPVLLPDEVVAKVEHDESADAVAVWRRPMVPDELAPIPVVEAV